MDTIAGRRIPTDPEGVNEDDGIYDRLRHRTHFITCPQSAYWMRARVMSIREAVRLSNSDPIASYYYEKVF